MNPFSLLHVHKVNLKKFIIFNIDCKYFLESQENLMYLKSAPNDEINIFNEVCDLAVSRNGNLHYNPLIFINLIIFNILKDRLVYPNNA